MTHEQSRHLSCVVKGPDSRTGRGAAARISPSLVFVGVMACFVRGNSTGHRGNLLWVGLSWWAAVEA